MAAEEPTDATTEPTARGATEPRAGGAGDFERYALIAALTVVVLCLLLVDRLRADPAAQATPAPNSTLKVQLGGPSPPPSPPVAPPAVSPDVRAQDPPLVQPPPTPGPPPAPPRSYTVRDGDTLSEIARRELGSTARAAEIARLNGISDPSKIRAGQVLQLPR